MRRLKLATRGSPLALAQSGWVRDRLAACHPGVAIELEVITTTGDRVLDRPLREVGGKGVFLKEIEEALLDGRADLAVHSLKDVPGALPDGLVLAAYPPREDARDALLVASGLVPTLAELPHGARLGTSSLRRAAQALALRPDLVVEPLRGNVGTRIRRLDEGAVHAIVLAHAGLRRLGHAARADAVLDPTAMVPAIGQGALAIEARADDAEVAALVAALDDAPTRTAVTAERVLLERLEGDCKVPLGGHARLVDGRLELVGLVARPDGAGVLVRRASGDAADPRAVGATVCDALFAAGAGEILAEVRRGG